MKLKFPQLVAAVALLASSKSFSQSYNFTHFNSTYTEITSGTVVTTPGWDYFTIIDKKLPFTLQFFGVPEDSLYIMSGFAAFHQNGAGDFTSSPQIYFCDAELVERSTGGPSNISIQISGSAPNRIYKVQTKNAGFESDASGTEYANVQLWLYESTNVIEIHFGPCNASAATFNPLPGPTVGIFKDQTSFVSLSGPASNPSASTTMASLGVTGIPSSGKVYRFTPGVAGLKDVENRLSGSIFPNPTSGTINYKSGLRMESALFEIINSLGQVVYERKLTMGENEIQEMGTNLSPGIYSVRVSYNDRVSTPTKLIIK